jgi:phosphatidylglycerophosphate synthase
MTRRPTLADIRERTYKHRDAWWTVWLVDPLASRLVWLVAPWRWVTPNRLTLAAFGVGIGAAACFWQGDRGWVLAGALLFHLSFVLDCMDGKIARLNGTGSLFGTWLDYVFDRLRVFVCAFGLFGGQYASTGEVVYVWLTTVVIFLDMFRYLNVLQMQKVRLTMRERLLAAGGMPAPAAEAHSDEEPRAAGAFGRLLRIRDLLLRQRIRAHLFSGIEFMMFVFIVGPVIGHIVATTVVSGVLLLGFEALLVLRLWTATRTFHRRLATLT